MIYRFIDTEKANYPITVLCRVLSVPQSSYFRWDQCGRARADEYVRSEAALVEVICQHTPRRATPMVLRKSGRNCATRPSGLGTSSCRNDN